jgi:MerR family transcriptional regulator/heat shock protein HspR
MKRNKNRTYTISAVAEQYGLHQQTLRLYEREGLIKPSRSDGNTRLYTDADLERLEVILSLTPRHPTTTPPHHFAQLTPRPRRR